MEGSRRQQGPSVIANAQQLYPYSCYGLSVVGS